MISTYYGLDALGGGGAFFAALVIGFFFGLALERAGFGSSRRISGIFYFRDMAVLKVMFTALVVAMLGLAFVSASGVIDLSQQIHYIKTYYGAYVVGGLIFGIG
ncbi:MAG: YeeE/YedE family protein, partial [Proteobacteria bacterium]|nr:YeeE/YedE family protein [Pseudomonadota bacterium]